MSSNDYAGRSIPLSLPYRIFLASPGDVYHERSIVDEVVNELRAKARYRNLLNIQLIAWDQPGVAIPLSAGLTPQEAIKEGLPLPSACDLVICIFWWRIGTLLSGEFVKPNGERYLSGTEWEYLDGINAFCRKGTPQVLIYQRLPPPRLPPDDPDFDDFTAQWRSLQVFLTSLQNDDGSFAAGINSYAGPDEFRPAISSAIEGFLDRAAEAFKQHIPPDKRQLQGLPVSWKGNPYPGASAFSPELGDVFFGREREIDQLLERVSASQNRLLVVTGASGSGKSSLLQGGLIPRLRKGFISSASWVDVIMRPGYLDHDPFRSLAIALYALGDQKAQMGLDIGGLAEQLEQQPGELVKLVNGQLNRTDLQGKCIILIDQLEELFTIIDSDLANRFLLWIKVLIKQPQILVVASMRSDFYALAATHPVMAEMLRDEHALFPLTLPSDATMREIIEKPAQAAGIKLEEGLVDKMVMDAGHEGGALALTAFALHELYEQGHHDGLLSLHEYMEMGGIKGAISKKVDTLLSSNRQFSAESLDQLFTLLVKFNADSMPTRQRVRKDQAKKPELVDALAAARVLLVENSGEVSTIEIAHEALFEGWPTLCDWIKDSTQRLLAERDLEQTAREWQDNGRPFNGLRGGQLLARYRTAKQTSAQAQDYLRACAWRSWALKINMIFMAMIVGLSFPVYVHIQSSHYPMTFAAKGLAVRWGILPVNGPEMALIPANNFAMGDLGDDCRLPTQSQFESMCQIECDEGEQPGSCLTNERPVRNIRIQTPFMLGKYEVSFAEYDLFAAATGRRKPDDEQFTLSSSKRGEYPTINVTWDDAHAYSQWITQKTGEEYRLPSEAEWEYAARAGTSTGRFWESAPVTFENACDYANVYDIGHRDNVIARYGTVRRWSSFSCSDAHVFSAPVASADYQPNAWGVYQMLGNVGEWVEDCYAPSYSGKPADGTAYRETENNKCQTKVIRGGNWLSNPLTIRAAYRADQPQHFSDVVVGFRIAKSTTSGR